MIPDSSATLLFRIIAILTISTTLPSRGEDWPQGSGVNGDFRSSGSAPTEWSVALNQSIRWKITLPETGQNTPIVADGKVFFSTMKPVDADSKLGSDIVAWCCVSKTGKILWQRDITGKYPLRLSGCFSDSTSPPPVYDRVGDRVVFVNASGTIACLSLEGKLLWQKEILSVGRCVPFLSNGKLIFTRQIYPPDADGNFPHKYADSPAEMWTQLQALDMASGEVIWTSTCGVNMGCTIVPGKLSDGREVIFAGRGGGHGPPEKPDGVSMIDANDGSTIWTLPLDDFMATMSFRVRNDQLHIFHRDEHLSIDTVTGKITSQVSIVDHIPVRRLIDGARVTQRETLPAEKSRMITQGSNLLVDRYHYFRSYTHPYLGRVNVDSGSVEYLELPLQLVREQNQEDQFAWYEAPPAPAGKKKKIDKRFQIQYQALVANEARNSRGFIVMGDDRSVGNGWGHVAAPSPTVAGNHLYVPVMNGTVYVLNWRAKSLDESAIVAINDLGPAGKSWTRASLSFAEDAVYAHTIRELICIGKPNLLPKRKR